MQAVEISVVVKVVSMLDIWFISSPGHLDEIYTSDTTPLLPQRGYSGASCRRIRSHAYTISYVENKVSLYTSIYRNGLKTCS